MWSVSLQQTLTWPICEEEGAKFCVKVSSLDKRDNISIIKQPRWFYYTANGRERCQQGNESILWSLHHLCLSEKCQRKVESRASISDTTMTYIPDGWWGWAKSHVTWPNHPQNGSVFLKNPTIFYLWNRDSTNFSRVAPWSHTIKFSTYIMYGCQIGYDSTRV